MPRYASTLTRAAIPTLALLASATTAGAAAQAAAQPSPTPATPDLAVATTPLEVGTPATTPAAPPKSGRLVRITERRLTVTGGGQIRVRGRATTVPVHVELRVAGTDRVLDRAAVQPGRKFRLEAAARAGDHLRLVVRRTDGGVETSDLKVGTVRKLRATTASWYGPGLFGNRTACGQTLTSGLRGVAHKTLPCGTKLTFRFRGRTTRAVVVDRGPFHAGREFDLTQATARAIGFHAVGRVWVASH